MTIKRAGLPVSGTGRDAALRARSAKLMGHALARLPVRPVRGEAAFFDDRERGVEGQAWLARHRERDRDNERHPKKYFAARRGVAR
jgi:hypothetical protein